MRTLEPRIIDCEIHNSLPTPEALAPYLPNHWSRYFLLSGLRHRSFGVYFAGKPHRHAARADAVPPSGSLPGSDLAFTRRQHLDRWNIEYAILDPGDQLGFGSQPPEYAAALTRALNDWVLAEWLEPEPRLYAGICVPIEDGTMAAREIDRIGDHPRFVHVLLNSMTRDPLGHRKYWKIYEAAVRHDLPVSIHFGGGMGSNAITAGGWPSYYVELRTAFAQAGQCQLISLISEGVFERFPTLKVVMLEVGYSWLPSLMSRFDAGWQLWRHEVPYLTHQPSEYVQRHCWFNTQPVEEPEKREHLTDLIDWFVEVGMEDRLMFSSDYPHWDFDAPAEALRDFPEKARNRIYADNARALYRLPAELPGEGVSR